MLVKEASKLTLEQNLQIIGEYHIERILKSSPDRWLSNARLTQYQVQLLNSPSVQFLKSAALSPATLLLAPDPTIMHSCHEILERVTGVRPDLRDEAYEKPELTLFSDSSSFLREGQPYAGAAVTTETEVIWQQALPKGTSAQRVELIGHLQGLILRKLQDVPAYLGTLSRRCLYW